MLNQLEKINDVQKMYYARYFSLILTLLSGLRNCSIVVIPESNRERALAGPIPATRVRRLIAVVESSDRIYSGKIK